MPTTLDDYRDRYEHFAFDRTAEGILTVGHHTGGGPHVHTGEAHTEFAEVFHDIGRDAGNEVVIWTGTGGTWIDAIDFSTVGDVTRPEGWHKILSEARATLQGLVDVPVPLIAVVPGPATVHGEYAMLADVVLARARAHVAGGEHAGQVRLEQQEPGRVADGAFEVAAGEHEALSSRATCRLSQPVCGSAPMNTNSEVVSSSSWSPVRLSVRASASSDRSPTSSATSVWGRTSMRGSRSIWSIR